MQLLGGKLHGNFSKLRDQSKRGLFIRWLRARGIRDEYGASKNTKNSQKRKKADLKCHDMNLHSKRTYFREILFTLNISPSKGDGGMEKGQT